MRPGGSGKENQMKLRSVIFAGLLGVYGATGCDQFDKIKGAKESAEFALYYASLGTQMGAVEEQWATVFPKVNAAAQKRKRRKAAIQSLNGLVDQLESIVNSNAPTSPDAHKGHQAALNMVKRRRAAVLKLKSDWKGTKDKFKSSEQVVSFSNEWMAARTDFMSAVGKESQKVFGAAAARAEQGAAAASPAAAEAIKAAREGH